MDSRLRGNDKGRRMRETQDDRDASDINLKKVCLFLSADNCLSGENPLPDRIKIYI
jgi:hypothetical protein